MECLGCKNELLNIYEGNFLDNISYDFCEKCGGMWLDSGELDKIAFETPGSVEFCSAMSLTNVAQRWWDDHPEVKPLHPFRECLRCPGETLAKMHFMEDSGTILDYCTKCGGIWLDKGELNKINTYIEWFDKNAAPSRFGRFLRNVHGSFWHKVATQPSIDTNHHIKDVSEIPTKRSQPIKTQSTDLPCPRDNTKLDEMQFYGMTLDQCPSCKGYWFDAGELRQTRDAILKDTHWMDVELWKEGKKVDAKALKVQCPTCHAPLAEIHYDQSDIVIDICTGCRGVWLDQGELKHILKYLEHEILTQSWDEVKRNWWEQFLEIFKGPKGLVAEFNDFLAVSQLLQIKFAVDNPDLVKKLQASRASLPF